MDVKIVEVEKPLVDVSIDWSKCFFCQKNEEVKLQSPNRMKNLKSKYTTL